jgi:protein-tyrosine phosphatase
MMRATIFWIPGPWLGRLAIVLRPRGGDWLDGETGAWRDAGVDVVISLLESSEEAELDLSSEASSAAENELEFRSFSIPDRGVPESCEAVGELVTLLTAALQAGKTVAVHCRQGIGRSALIAAATLISFGEDSETALGKIASARGLAVPETDAQRRWISEFASWIESSRP